MTEKEIRVKQLEALKSGCTSPDYILEITSFDGRPISRKKYDNERDLVAAYYKAKSDWNQATYVHGIVAFNID